MEGLPIIFIMAHTFVLDAAGFFVTATPGASCTDQGASLVYPYGGKPPYQYSLDSINFVTVNYSGNYIESPYEYKFKNLQPGLYHVYAKDSTGAIAVSAFTVSKSCYVAITYVEVDASCQKNDGSLTINANYGTPPYSYTIDGINYQSSNIFTGLATGSYSITVADANEETYSIEATVYNKCPTVTATALDDTCNQKKGSIFATGYKGTLPYQFSMDGITFQTDSVFTGLPAGNYTIVIRDANGFTDSTTTTIFNNCLQLSLLAINTTCSKSNGNITATASNGTSPYQYSIDGINFQTNSQFNNLAPGNYIITAKDAAGLTAIVTDSVGNSPPKISAALSVASCIDTGGGISIIRNGGTSPFQYSINNGSTFQSDSIFTSLDSGQYIAFVQDANGCTAADTVQLTALLTPTAALGNDTMLCTGQTLLLSAPQASGYQYLWQDNSTTNTYTVSTPGAYTVKVTNQFNCSASATINVRFKPLPVFSIGNDTVLCSGHPLLIQPVVLLQGTYLWSDGSTATTLNVNSPGLYWLQISDSGCAKTDSITVSYKPMPSLNLGNDTTLCTAQTLLLDATNNNSTYLWQDGSTQPTFTVDTTGVYSVKVDENGCDTSGNINVNYITKPVVNLGNDTTLCITQQLLLDATYPLSTYLWQDGSVQPQYTVSHAGTYLVDVTNVCGDTKDSISVAYENCACKFYVPSAITPNNDGKNDVFLPKYQCLYSNYQLKVFNRWGLLVFVSTNASVGWDGGFNSQQQPAGVYVWELAYKDNLTGKDMRKNGTVVLIR